MLRVAVLTTDGRDLLKKHAQTSPEFGSAPQALLQGFMHLPDVEIHVISCLRKPVTSPEKLAPNVFFHSLCVPKTGWMRTLYWGCARAARKKLNEIQPDIVHGQGTERECAISAALSGFPNVITLHGVMRRVAKVVGAKPFSFYWLAARLESFAVRKTRGVVCLTGYTKTQVQSLARKTWIVPNAVNETFYTVERRPDPEPMVLCVAHVAPYKNQNQLIRSLDPIAAANKFRLHLVGGVNPLTPYSVEFLELVKARPWCVFEGLQLGDALKSYFQTASLLVLPTLEDNCPMVVLEAMAAGLPVAASRIGGIPDLINPGVDGLLFDPRKPAEIGAAVLQLLSNPAAAAGLASAAKRRSLQNHHPARIAAQHLEIYREVLRRPS